MRRRILKIGEFAQLDPDEHEDDQEVRGEDEAQDFASQAEQNARIETLKAIEIAFPLRGQHREVTVMRSGDKDAKEEYKREPWKQGGWKVVGVSKNDPTKVRVEDGEGTGFKEYNRDYLPKLLELQEFKAGGQIDICVPGGERTVDNNVTCTIKDIESDGKFSVVFQRKIDKAPKKIPLSKIQLLQAAIDYQTVERGVIHWPGEQETVSSRRILENIDRKRDNLERKLRVCKQLEAEEERLQRERDGEMPTR